MKETIIKFIVLNIIIISFLIYSTFNIHNYYLEKRGEEKKTFTNFLNNTKNSLSFKSILLGLIFGIVFGFIDNFGLWMGMNVLEKYLPGGILTKSALGNTYSNFLGAIFGTCISIIAFDIFNYEDNNTPIWTSSIGIALGCILGLLVGKVFTGKK